MVALFIVLVLLVIGVVTFLFTALPRMFLKSRQNSKNAERAAFAAGQGWQFAPYAPDLLTRWRTRPFTERGDRRVAFGAITGMYNGVHFTAFDFQLRTHVRITNGAQSETNEVHTVWVIHLPVPLPSVEVSRRGLLGTPQQHEVQVHPEFLKQYSVTGADHRFTAELLTPAAMQLITQYRLDFFAILGQDLVYSKKNTLGRTSPQELVQTVDALRGLIATFPQHLWQRA